MKKLFTLVAFLACFLGAKAEWVEVYSIDYSTYQGFPFYVMGYVPEWYDGVMTDFGANYKYVQVTEDAEETSDVIVKTQNGVEYYKIPVDGSWHQYFIADGIPTQIDGSYKVKAMVKASQAVTINVNMGWGWGDGQQASASVAIGTDWTEVEWEYSGIAGASCNLVAQPGSATATIEWKNLVVFENQKKTRPVEWIELISNGDASKTWAELGLADVKFNDADNNYKICAWGKEREVNMNEDGGWDPFPATIEADPADASNNVFVVHGKAATTEGDASAWDNQFWIQSTRAWKSGEQAKIKFRYKASKAVAVATQTHYQQPSSYLIWHAIGDINFTEDWQTFDQTVTFSDDMTGGWSVAFQLNQNDKDAIDFYFDDLSWQEMKLDHGYFVAGCSTIDGTEYDLDNAIEFVEGEDSEGGPCLVATVGEKGAYVNQVMISTVRGNDAAFKGSTLKPAGAITNDPQGWMDYSEQSLAKLTLPGNGIWKIYLDTEYKAMAFEMTEGKEIKPLNIQPNPTEIVINALEREPNATEQPADENGEGAGTGQAWDNQFWIKANRVVEAGEVTVIQFKYKAAKDAASSTQCHAEPGAYIHWAAIDNVNFTTDWQDFEQTFTIPGECAGKNFQSIAFNLAEIRDTNTYEIKDVVWKLEDNTETLINETGSDNFFFKVVGGAIEQYQGGSGINNITNNNKINSAVIYNLAGQRVSKDYKGIVVTNGKKVVNK